MSTTRTKMTIEGSGELKDGNRYTYSRELKLTETKEREGDNTVTREVAEERTEIGGEVLKVKVVRVDGEVTAEEVDGADVRDVRQFEREWYEVNRRWSRVHHVPGLSNLYNHSQTGSSSSGFFRF